MAATVWKGNLTFGLVSVPVRLYRAARPERVRFRQLRRTAPPEPEPPGHETAYYDEPAAPPPPAAGPAPRGREQVIPFPARESRPPEAPAEPAPVFSRVTQRSYDPGEDAPVPRSEIVRGYEYGKDRFVVVEENDLRPLAPQTSSDMEIREFVRFAEIDPVFLETSYYMAPGPGGEKAYAMLDAALRSTGYAALAEFAMHRREHVVVLRPGRHGIIAHTMFYADEVKEQEEYRAEPALVNPKEKELAEVFIRALAAPFDASKYRDRYRQRVEAMLAGKIGTEQFVETRPAAPGPAAPSPDIMEALRRSLEAIRKPPAAETSPPAAPKARPSRVRPRKRP